MPDADRQPARFTFRPRHRLTHARQFEAVYHAKMRKARGGLVVFTRPNSLPHGRLGLSVSARTTPRAVDRNRVKRLIREWFRMNLHVLPTFPTGSGEVSSLDIIVSVRSSSWPNLAALTAALNQLTAESAAEWKRRKHTEPGA